MINSTLSQELKFFKTINIVNSGRFWKLHPQLDPKSNSKIDLYLPCHNPEYSIQSNNHISVYSSISYNIFDFPSASLNMQSQIPYEAHDIDPKKM